MSMMKECNIGSLPNNLLNSLKTRLPVAVETTLPISLNDWLIKRQNIFKDCKYNKCNIVTGSFLGGCHRFIFVRVLNCFNRDDVINLIYDNTTTNDSKLEWIQSENSSIDTGSTRSTWSDQKAKVLQLSVERWDMKFGEPFIPLKNDVGYNEECIVEESCKGRYFSSDFKIFPFNDCETSDQID